MVCISKECDKCRSHFTKQLVHKKCYSDKEFMTSCEDYEKLLELRKTKKPRVYEEMEVKQNGFCKGSNYLLFRSFHAWKISRYGRH